MRADRKKLYTITPQARAHVLDLLSTEIAQDLHIAFAYAYGSLLERDAVHDVDVGIYLGKEPEGGRERYALSLAQRLSESAGLPVDVRILNAVPISFLFHVLRGRLVHCRDENLLGNIIERTVARYLDIAPLLRRATKEAYTP
ncbi:MAG: nucleotidyltransferase domain-containing protein [Acidiferrobacterales bacterium]